MFDYRYCSLHSGGIVQYVIYALLYVLSGNLQNSEFPNTSYPEGFGKGIVVYWNESALSKDKEVHGGRGSWDSWNVNNMVDKP